MESKANGQSRPGPPASLGLSRDQPREPECIHLPRIIYGPPWICELLEPRLQETNTCPGYVGAERFTWDLLPKRLAFKKIKVLQGLHCRL